jgi:hypothetical protein
MITLLIAGCLLIVFWRLSIVDAEKKALLPERHYQFMVEMELEGHNKNVSVRMTLPLETGGQSVRDEGVKSSNFPFSIEKERLVLGSGRGRRLPVSRIWFIPAPSKRITSNMSWRPH